MPARVYGNVGRPELHCRLRWGVTLPEGRAQRDRPEGKQHRRARGARDAWQDLGPGPAVYATEEHCHSRNAQDQRHDAPPEVGRSPRTGQARMVAQIGMV